ncbi:transposase [Pseudomonas sp. R1-18]|uniref:REP-associated tyrosine transposase n=1 Tax=Pseudomonas sp. R1-18 TaxID=1632772 RepID=UPI003DA80669
MSKNENSHRLRTGRFSGAGQIYLVTATTQGRAPVFADWVLGRLLVREMKGCEEQNLACSLARVVMPDHFHWLFKLGDGALSSLIQRVKSKSAIAVNKATGCEGRLWQRGYHDKAIRKEEDVLGFARYIVANPLRAGLVNSIGQYPLWDAVWL